MKTSRYPTLPYQMYWGPSADLLMVATNDGTVNVHASADLAPLWSLKGHTHSCYTMAIDKERRWGKLKQVTFQPQQHQHPHNHARNQHRHKHGQPPTYIILCYPLSACEPSVSIWQHVHVERSEDTRLWEGSC